MSRPGRRGETDGDAPRVGRDVVHGSEAGQRHRRLATQIECEGDPLSPKPGPLRFDKREPCASCPYRTDAPLELWSPEEFEGLIRNDRDQVGTLYGCHEFNKRRQEAQVCVGWLINQRERNVPSIALRLRLINSPEARDCITEASSPAPLFESIEEMCEANGVEY